MTPGSYTGHWNQILEWALGINGESNFTLVSSSLTILRGAIVILDHVLNDQVAVQFVRVILLISPTPVLIGPLNLNGGVLALIGTTLEVFLQGI